MTPLTQMEDNVGYNKNLFHPATVKHIINEKGSPGLVLDSYKISVKSKKQSKKVLYII